MKKLIIFIAVAVLFTYSADSFAQTFGVRGGLNMTNMLSKSDAHTADFKTKVGYHIGGTAEFEITDMFSFETGLFLSTMGYKYEGEMADYTTNLLYLNIPITAKARYELDNFNLYGLFGPYIGLGLSGKYKADDNSEDIKWGSGDSDDLKRLDFGWTIGAGIEYEAFMAGLSYNLGLANIAAQTEGGYKAKNRAFLISVGYRFGVNK
ncbi:MAG: hypothetical protein CVT99_02085 [Bacteroidetes bacterium HGW-Bacteroidetes-16]|jgi:opacity protein-like surface antigen|nr:MAG: hypothetical protein CVT99_02085 [Bacteroidetes bacterium HGW-Bacteroidetes-16]